MNNLVNVHLKRSGHCWASAHHAVKGDKRQRIRFDALWAEIHHPTHGLVLFDTGYTARFHQETRYWPNRLYARLTEVEILPCDEAHQQVDAAEVKHVLLSHLHADHVGGLRDFHQAEIWASQAAVQQFQKTPRWRAVAKGLLHGLFPEDWTKRWRAFELANPVEHEHLGPGFDLFGDGSIQVFSVPGHAAGQMGALLATTSGPVFLAADAFWNFRAVSEGALPHPIVRLFFDDWSAYQATLVRLRKFHEASPDVPLVGTHCPKASSWVDEGKSW